MQKKTLKGLVIKEVDTFESSKILTLLTDEGPVTAGANNCRIQTSPLFGGCHLFCYSEFMLTEGRQVMPIISCEPIESFYGIRLCSKRLSLAQGIAAALAICGTPNTDMGAILSLALNTLYILSKAEAEDIARIRCCFYIRLAAELGFALMLDSCVYCGSEEDFVGISAHGGGMVCSDCVSVMPSGKYSQAALSCLRHITSASLKQLFAFTVAAPVMGELEAFTRQYINYHIEPFRKLLRL